MSKTNSKDKTENMKKNDKKVMEPKEVKTRKRMREASNDLPNSKITIMKEPKIRSVKQKIDFSEDTDKLTQINNNVTKKVPVNSKFSQIGKTESKVKIWNLDKQDKVKSDRVQLTQEFLDKVRRSNERNQRKLKMSKQNVAISLQPEPQIKGDGIKTEVEGEEEVDYEDDLSIDDLEMGVEPTDLLEEEDTLATADAQVQGKTGTVV